MQPAMQREDELVTLTSYDNPVEAQLAMATLGTRGIEAFLGDEHIVTMNPLFAHAVGGVKLQVRRRDAQEAAELLFEKASPNAALLPRGRSSAFVKSKHCPACRSDQLRFYGITPYKLLMTGLLCGTLFFASHWSLKVLGGALLFFGLLALIPGKYHRCQDCGARW